MKIKLKDILSQSKNSEYIDHPENEKYVTVSGHGQGVKERVIGDGKTPVKFNGYRVKQGQLIYSRIGATDGAFGIVPKSLDNAVVSKDFPVFNVDPSKANIEYLIYYLTSDLFCNIASRESFGATMTRLREDKLLDCEIELPSLTEQLIIVTVLGEVKRLVLLRQKELQKLDELIKARFVELFGTLDNPSQEFTKASLKELCNKITDGKHGGCKAEEGTERYFVGAREIYDDEVHYDTAPEINIDEFEKDYKRCNIEIGDFLIVNTGATIGKSAIATDERTEHTLLQKSVALLKVKKEVLNPVFLKWCYRVNTKMYIVESASAQPNLLLSKINATVIYVPDMELQNQFANFVEQVDKSKAVVQKALEKSQLLFDSLMQEYFG